MSFMTKIRNGNIILCVTPCGHTATVDTDKMVAGYKERTIPIKNLELIEPAMLKLGLLEDEYTTQGWGIITSPTCAMSEDIDMEIAYKHGGFEISTGMAWYWAGSVPTAKHAQIALDSLPPVDIPNECLLVDVETPIPSFLMNDKAVWVITRDHKYNPLKAVVTLKQQFNIEDVNTGRRWRKVATLTFHADETVPARRFRFEDNDGLTIFGRTALACLYKAYLATGSNATWKQ